MPTEIDEATSDEVSSTSNGGKNDLREQRRILTLSRALRPRNWPRNYKITAGLLFLAFALFLFVYIKIKLDLVLVIEGWIALFSGILLLVWYLVDGLTRRRDIYAFFGELEDPIKPTIRLWRRVVSLALILGATTVAVLETPLLTDASDLSRRGTTVAFLFGAFIAAFGWIYTTFEKEKIDRINHTLDALREHMYGNFTSQNFKLIRLFFKHYKNKEQLQTGQVIDPNLLQIKICDLDDSNDIQEYGQVTYQICVDEFFNAMDQIAYGVRQGHFDFDTIQRILRPRFVASAYIFADYIRKETNAEFDNDVQRWVAKKRTWEHFLWLVAKLPVYEPNTDIKQIVLPPFHLSQPNRQQQVIFKRKKLSLFKGKT
ncbi:MAG: hypothetical protein AAF720_00770 [Pseudomonadota bacterium]